MYCNCVVDKLYMYLKSCIYVCSIRPVIKGIGIDFNKQLELKKGVDPNPGGMPVATKQLFTFSVYWLVLFRTVFSTIALF